MSSQEPEPDRLREEDRALLDADANGFLDALARSRADRTAARKLEELSRIRSVFNSVLDEVLDDTDREPSFPRFPGFTVLEKAGQGAFGAVYRARDEKLDREVALKVLLPRFDGGPGACDSAAKERFIREARALARVRHPNVLAVHSVLDEGDRVALVTEFIEGQPLSEVLEEKGPLSAAETAQAGAEICRALAAVHAAGIVHRDVKTPNLLRERGGRLVLADFGLGAFIAEGKDLERCGFVAGSPLFMAPEQIRGEELNPRMDLYSLGVVLYNLSTGKFPVAARSLHDLFAKIRAGALVPLRDARPDLPEGFTQVVTRALALDPEKRHQTAGELERELLSCSGISLPPPCTAGQAMEPLGSAERPPPAGFATRPPIARPRHRGRLLVAGSALAALLLAAAAVLLLAPRDAFHIRVEPRCDGRPLADGDRIAVGDGISLRLEADRPLHVYVIDEDDTGEVNALFPREDVPVKNPLPAGRIVDLPGVQGSAGWEVTSRGGAEAILVIASLEPLGEVEEALSKERLTPQVVLRGITRVKAAGPGGRHASRSGLAVLFSEMGRAAKNSDEARGLWVRKITLRNP